MSGIEDRMALFLVLERANLMKKSLAFFTLISIACFAAPSHLCAAATKAAERRAKSEIKQVLDTQVAAWNRGDLEGFMQGYWNSPDLVFISGGDIRRGWESALKHYREAYPDRARMGELSFSDLEIHLLASPDQTAPNAAWVLGRWRLKRANDQPHGVFTLIFQKFPSPDRSKDSGWKIVHDHTSSSQ